jgi:hypothetical protein
MQSESRLKLILHKILSKQGSALKSGGLEWDEVAFRVNGHELI